MRWAMVLGWLLAAAAVRAEAPMDLDSPFHKTVILESRIGQREEFEILRAKLVGENLEMVKLDASVLLAPRQHARAMLPKLPADGARYTQKDAERALSLLRVAQKDWPDRPETSARTLAVWEQLATGASPFEREKDAQRAAAVEQWLGKIQPEEGKPRPIDLTEYVREGELLANKGGPEAEEVKKQLEKVRNLMAMDFGEIRGKALPTEWPEISPLLPVGLAGFLLILGFWVLGNLGNFSAALKSGVVRTAQKGGESRTSFNLKGIVYLVYAMAGGALIYFLLQPGASPTGQGVSESAAGVAERAFYLSMNAQKRWSTQSKSSLEVETAALIAGLQNMLPAGEFRLSQVLAYLGPQVVWGEGRIFWRQTLKLAFVPVHLDFWFHPSAESFYLEKPALDGCRIGQVPLGGFVGGLLWGRFAGITVPWDQALGLQNGVVWSWAEAERFRVEAPAVTSRRDEKKQAELAGKKKAEFKESIGAEELARVFAEGDGDVYRNRTINLTGRIKSVSSTRRLGNTLASEMTRNALAKAGGPEAVNAVAPSGQEDFPDEFFLDASQEDLDAKIQVKVLVKCPHTYSLDTRGDLYRSGTSPNLDTPVVARQKQALFQGGRVEGMERNVIEIYGAQPPEEVP